MLQASPGNLLQLEDVLFGSYDMSSSLTIMAVKLSSESGQRTLGVAYTEPSSELFGVAEFVENDQFSNLEVSGCVMYFVMFSVVLSGLAGAVETQGVPSGRW